MILSAETDRHCQLYPGLVFCLGGSAAKTGGPPLRVFFTGETCIRPCRTQFPGSEFQIFLIGRWYAGSQNGMGWVA
jgi:hypothetical protein